MGAHISSQFVETCYQLPHTHDTNLLHRLIVSLMKQFPHVSFVVILLNYVDPFGFIF